MLEQVSYNHRYEQLTIRYVFNYFMYCHTLLHTHSVCASSFKHFDILTKLYIQPIPRFTNFIRLVQCKCDGNVDLLLLYGLKLLSICDSVKYFLMLFQIYPLVLVQYNMRLVYGCVCIIVVCVCACVSVCVCL